MDFEKNVPTWDATGTEPPQSLKTSGFTAGYRPPAAFFNWFWHGVSACLTEIRTKLKGHAESTSNPHGVTAAQVGLDKVNNTADADKNVKYATTSGTADKVKSNMVVRLNGGSTEGTDMLTYNGSAAKSVDVTADKIGAAKKDLSNVDTSAFKSAASAAGIGGGTPIVAAASTDGVVYTATVDGVTALTNGLMITIIPSMTSTSASITLNVNSLGAKAVKLPLSFNNAAMTSPNNDTFYAASRPLTLQYDANYTTSGAWKVLGKEKTSAQDLYGTVPVGSGGTGRESVTAGSFLIGNGTEAMVEKTPAEVLTAIGAAATSHNQAANTITAGTLAGKVQANQTAMAETGAQVRDIVLTTTDPGAGSTSTYPDGTVICVYE